MKRFIIPLLALLALIVLVAVRSAPPPPLYPGVVPYEQLDVRNFELSDYPVLRIMPFMPRGAPPYLAVDTWSFAVNTNNWQLYGFNPLNNTWHHVANMNPTDGFVPVRESETVFADSGWYQIKTNRYAFGGFTNQWLCVPDMASGLALGYLSAGLTNGTFPEGTIAIGDGVMPGVRGAGTHNIGIGESALNKIAEGYNNIAIGTLALGKAVDGAGNIAITPGGLPNLTSGSLNIDIGSGNTILTTEIATLSMAGGMATNSFDMVIGIPSHQRIMFPIASYTGTGSRVLTDNGTYQTVGAAGGTNTLWTNYVARTDMEGGTVYGLYSLNALTNGSIAQAVNLLPAFWGDNSTISFYGMNENNAVQLAEGNANISSLGDWGGWSTVFTNSGSISMIGDAVLNSATVTNSFDIFAMGWSPADSAGFTNSVSLYMVGSGTVSGSDWTEVTNAYAWGTSALSLSTLTNVTDIHANGRGALQAASLSNSTNIYAWGTDAGTGLTGDGYSDIYLFGPAQPTRKTNEFTFGDTDYLYSFPGSNGVWAADVISQGPIIDVRKFGATGDGVTDDSAAIQAAINALPILSGTRRGTVLIPNSPNSFKVSNTLSNGADSSIIIRGVSAWQTLDFSGLAAGKSAFQFYGTSRGSQVENLRILGPGPSTISTGITAGASVALKNVMVQSFQTGVWMPVGFNGLVIDESCEFYGNGIGVRVNDNANTISGRYFYNTNAITTSGDETRIVRAWFELNYGTEITITNSVSTLIRDCWIEPGHTTNVIRMVRTSPYPIPRQVVIDGNYFSVAGTNLVYADAVLGLKLTHNKIDYRTRTIYSSLGITDLQCNDNDVAGLDGVSDKLASYPIILSGPIVSKNFYPSLASYSGSTKAFTGGHSFSTTANLVPDGSWESGVTNATAAGATPPLISLDTGYTGNALKVIFPNTDSGVNSYVRFGATNSLSAGDIVTISFTARSDYTNRLLLLRPIDLAAAFATSYPYYINVNTNWARYDVKWEVPSTSAQWVCLSFMMSATPSAAVTVWFDDVSVSQGDIPIPYTQIRNYERGTTYFDNVSIATNFVNEVVVTNAATVATSIHAGGGLLQTPELYYGAARVYRTALTPIDAGTALNFALTNRSWTLSLTGAVSLTTANLLAGKCGNILITNAQATNCAFTFPAWIFIGYKPTYITAGKCARIDLESTSTTDAATYAYYGEQQ